LKRTIEQKTRLQTRHEAWKLRHDGMKDVLARGVRQAYGMVRRPFPISKRSPQRKILITAPLKNHVFTMLACGRTAHKRYKGPSRAMPTCVMLPLVVFCPHRGTHAHPSHGLPMRYACSTHTLEVSAWPRYHALVHAYHLRLLAGGTPSRAVRNPVPTASCASANARLRRGRRSNRLRHGRSRPYRPRGAMRPLGTPPGPRLDRLGGDG
jgi:hypothetical protein